MSEHVFALSEVLAQTYGAEINEDGLRAVLKFVEPRVIILQQRWQQKTGRGRPPLLRHNKAFRIADAATEAAEEAEEESKSRLAIFKAGELFARLTGSEQYRKKRADAAMAARLQFISLRQAQQLAQSERAQLVLAQMGKVVDRDTWPAALEHLKSVSQDSRTHRAFLCSRCNAYTYTQRRILILNAHTYTQRLFCVVYKYTYSVFVLALQRVHLYSTQNACCSSAVTSSFLTRLNS
jgi:hypothetical protein